MMGRSLTFLSLLLAAACVAAKVARDPIEDGVFYPQFHVRPIRHWINDPNGPFFDPRHGRYHLWMQYNPAKAVWGNMSWYHTVSDDLVHFRRIGVSLSNDDAYDVGGVFSGSVTLASDGSPVIWYTCVNASGAQKQCTATPVDPSDPDLVAWRKTAANPVIEAGPAPQRGLDNFRDPTTAWPLGNGTFRLAVGTALEPHTAAVALYDTESLVSEARFAGFLTTSTRPTSGMYECPDYFALRAIAHEPRAVAKNAMLFKESAQGVFQDMVYVGSQAHQAGGHESFRETCYAGVAGCGTAPPIGRMNARMLDGGRWYASKTFWDERNSRRVLWGWLNEDDNDFAARGWAGCQSIPRHVVFDDATQELLTPPIPEFAQLRRGTIATAEAGSMVQSVRINSSEVLTAAAGFAPGSASSAPFSVALRPGLELEVGFEAAKALIDSAGATRIEIGADVLVDGRAATANSGAIASTSTFVGVLVDRRFNLLRGHDQPGGTYAMLTPSGSTRADFENSCRGTCDSDRRCVAWSYNYTANVCELKSLQLTAGDPSASADPNMSTGRPAGPYLAVVREKSGSTGKRHPHLMRATLNETRPGVYAFSLRVFVDRSVLEVFKDGGRERVASRVYNANATSLVASAARVMGLSATQAAALGNITRLPANAWAMGSVWDPAPALLPDLHPPNGLVAIVIALVAVGVIGAVLTFFACRQHRAEQAAKALAEAPATKAYARLSDA